ncbi:MAG: sodium:solute symporter family protein [Eubacterium sp.]|nr:sodium:solute symporter family protein [Eubacterium sp.]
MKLPFLITMGIYLVIMLAVGIRDCRRRENFVEYAVAGRSQGTWTVIMTLLATVLGASTTIGITDTVYSIGFPGIWWLLFGALGLILQALFLSEKVRGIGADTLPHLAEIIIGKSASRLLACMIVISWIGVIAGQIVAISGLVTFATGSSSKVLMVIISAIVILYTALGGQFSVVKTDKIQLVVIVAGLLITCGYLYFTKEGAAGDAMSAVEFFNESYSAKNLLTQLFIIGGVYFLGPDILSRNFLSKDERTAKKSAWMAGIILAAVALIITLIGIWARLYVTPEQLEGQKTLLYLAGIVPKGIGIILSLGLLSAILSSTDTCMINAATILTRDLFGKREVKWIRIAVLGIGATATLFAVLGSGNIISILTGAYSIYTPGVIFPLLIAILCYKKRGIRKGIWLTAVICGGCFGLAGTFLSEQLLSLGLTEGIVSNLPLVGMGVSLVIALLSVRWGDSSALRASE